MKAFPGIFQYYSGECGFTVVRLEKEEEK